MSSLLTIPNENNTRARLSLYFTYPRNELQPHLFINKLSRLIY